MDPMELDSPLAPVLEGHASKAEHFTVLRVESMATHEEKNERTEDNSPSGAAKIGQDIFAFAPKKGHASEAEPSTVLRAESMGADKEKEELIEDGAPSDADATMLGQGTVALAPQRRLFHHIEATLVSRRSPPPQYPRHNPSQNISLQIVFMIWCKVRCR